MRMQVNLTAGRKYFIALTYPWSFSENEEYLQTLEYKMKKRKDLYFNKETLIHSREGTWIITSGRPLHLLAISGPDCYAFPYEKYI